MRAQLLCAVLLDSLFEFLVLQREFSRETDKSMVSRTILNDEDMQNDFLKEPWHYRTRVITVRQTLRRRGT